MKLIVGLGNPGKQYLKTRHNVGFMALDILQKELGTSDWSLSKKFNGDVSGATVKGEKIFLLKPTTYMNDSGKAVRLIASYYKIPVHDVIVVHDDKDLALGEIKIQEDRGHAGHNGVRSIIDCLGTKEFSRIRMGVSNPKKQEKMGTSNFVLGKFGLFEKKKLDDMLSQTVEALKTFLHNKK
jgi:peptidyl-tRNA hydrolase, PTH1 family